MRGSLAVQSANVDELNASLLQIEERLPFLFFGLWVEGYTNATAGEPVFLSHSYGVVPDEVLFRPSGDINMWVSDSDRLLWDETKIAVRGSAANTKFMALIVRFN